MSTPTTPRSGATSSMRDSYDVSVGCTGGPDGVSGSRPEEKNGPELRGSPDLARDRRADRREHPEGAVRRVQPGLGLSRARRKRRDLALLERALATGTAQRLGLARSLQRSAP